jgi:hypothetical protein
MARKYPDRVVLNPNAFLPNQKRVRSVRGGSIVTGGLPEYGLDLGGWLEHILQNTIINNFSVFQYYPIPEVSVWASTKNITASYSSGVITVIIPEDTILYACDVIGNNSLEESGILQIVFSYTHDNGLNKDISTLQIPCISTWEMNLSHFNDDDISEMNYIAELTALEIPRKIIKGESNDITLQFENLNRYAKWGIGIKFL